VILVTRGETIFSGCEYPNTGFCGDHIGRDVTCAWGDSL